MKYKADSRSLPRRANDVRLPPRGAEKRTRLAPWRGPPLRRGAVFQQRLVPLEWSAFESIGLSRGLKPTDTFYFNHQFYQACDPAARVVAIAEMPETPALFLRNHLCGIQFHPEKANMRAH